MKFTLYSKDHDGYDRCRDYDTLEEAMVHAIDALSRAERSYGWRYWQSAHIKVDGQTFMELYRDGAKTLKEVS